MRAPLAPPRRRPTSSLTSSFADRAALRVLFPRPASGEKNLKGALLAQAFEAAAPERQTAGRVPGRIASRRA